jgi:cell division protein FtsL
MKKKAIGRKGLSQKLWSVIILSGVVLLVTLKMYQSFKVDLLLKDIRNLEQSRRNLVNENRQLQADVDRLSNIDRVTDIAREKYGMVVNTDEPEVIIIEDVNQLRDIQKRFAERNENDETVNMAGVR